MSAASVADSSDQDTLVGSSEESNEPQQLQQQTPFVVPSDPEQERAITQVVEEFKAMPDWLAKRTLEVILGPASTGNSKLEWTDEADQEVLRAQAEKVLQETPAFEPVPRLPIFERPYVHEWNFSRFAVTADPYQVALISPLGVNAGKTPARYLFLQDTILENIYQLAFCIVFSITAKKKLYSSAWGPNDRYHHHLDVRPSWRSLGERAILRQCSGGHQRTSSCSHKADHRSLAEWWRQYMSLSSCTPTLLSRDTRDRDQLQVVRAGSLACPDWVHAC